MFPDTYLPHTTWFCEWSPLSHMGSFSIWAYLQLKHFLSQLDSDKIWAIIGLSRNSKTYALGSPHLRILQKWHGKGTYRLCLQTRNGTLLMKGSLNVTIQENYCKIWMRWYRTPSHLHTFSSSMPNTCWRWDKEVGAMLNIWWTCEGLHPFWQTVHDIIE